MKHTLKLIIGFAIGVSVGFSIAALGLVVIAIRIFAPLIVTISDSHKTTIEQISKYLYSGGISLALICLFILIILAILHLILNCMKPKLGFKTEVHR